MKYELTIFRPGINGFDKKGQPQPFPNEVEIFEASGDAEASRIAKTKFLRVAVIESVRRFIPAERVFDSRKKQKKVKKPNVFAWGHYNVSRVGA